MTTAVLELSANGQKLAADIQRMFGGVVANAGELGDQIARKFDQSVTPGLKSLEKKFGDTVKRAIAAGSDGASINLDLPGLTKSANELERRATVSRMLASGLERLAASSANVTKAQQLELQAAQQAATKHEEAARAARDHVVALETLQAELGQVGAAQATMSKMTDAQRFAMQNAGFQVQDFFVQVAGGTSVVRAFSLQAPQLIGALQMMGGQGEEATGKFAAFARLMQGGVGVAVGILIPLLAVAAEKMFGFGDSAEDAKKQNLDLSDAINFEKMGINELIKAIDELEAAQRKQLKTGYDAEQQALKNAEASLKAATAERDRAIALLQSAQANRVNSIKFAGAGGPSAAAGAAAASDAAIASYEAMIKKLTASQGVAERLVRETQVPIVKRQAEAAADPRKRISLNSDISQGRLDELYYEKGAISLAAYTKATNDLTAARERDLAALDKHTKSSAGAARAAATLSERGEDAAKKIANITDRFSGITKESSEAERALRELDDIATDFALKKPPDYDQLVKQLATAREIIKSSAQRELEKQIREQIKELREAAEIDAIRLRYGEQEASIAAAHLAIVRQFPTALSEQLVLVRQLAETEARRLDINEKLHDLIADVADTSNRRIDKALEDQKKDIQELAKLFEDLFSRGVGTIWDRFGQEGRDRLGKLAAELASQLKIPGLGSDKLKILAGGASLGVAGAQATGGSPLGGAVGGILGQEVGKAAGKAVGGILGSALGPIGGLLGGVLGGLAGGLFNTREHATTVITSGTQDLNVTGNRGTAIQSVTGAGNNVQTAINRIIGQIPGAVAGAFSVAIGKYGDYYRVSASGTQDPSAKYFSQHNTNPDSLYDGPDPAEAVRLAVLNALQDGAVKGIKAGTQRLLSAGKDLDANLSKALTFEQAFRDLRKYTDPLGAALDDVNVKFRQLRDIAVEAGASQEELLQLQDLYRRETAEAQKSVSESLKTYLQSLKVGSSSPLSLRDQEQAARSALQPFTDKILSGQSIDQDAFQKAAESFLDVERQLYGSTQAYFDQFDLVKTLTEKAIAQIDAQASKPADDPFASLIAQSTQATANILDQQSDQLEQQTSLLQQLLAAYGKQNEMSFLDQQRGYY